MISLRAKIGAGLALALVLWASLEAHDWWVVRQAMLSEDISRRDQAIALRDAQIRKRDRELDSLKRRDAVLAAAARAAAHRADSTAAGWDDAKKQLEADAAAHGGLVSIEQVHVAEQKADVALLDCQALNQTQAARIDELVKQVANQAETRTDLNANRAAADSNRVDVVKLLKPPLWKRSFSWLQDHAITLAAGAVGGFILAKR